MSKVLYTNGPPGVALTSLKLFAEIGETPIQTVVPSVATGDSTLVYYSFLNLDAGRYRIVCFVGTLEVSTDHVTVGNSDGNYLADSLAATQSGELTLSEENLTQIANAVRTTALSISSNLCSSGEEFCIRIGDTFAGSVDGVGDLSAAAVDEILVVIKSDIEDDDEDSLVKISSTEGLQIIAGLEASTSGNGVISVLDESEGDIAFTLDSSETAKLKSVRGSLIVKLLKTNNDRSIDPIVCNILNGGVDEVS